MESRRRLLLYWLITLLLATECIVGGVWGGLQLPPFIDIIRHLGYPAYFMSILGVWYMLAGVALLVPAWPRLKEWAYAGLIFNYTGAAASHLGAGDRVVTLIAPLLFTCLTAASWALRPWTRREPLQPSVLAKPPTQVFRGSTILYWVATAMVAAELALGGLWDILRISYVRRIIEELEYPEYFPNSIGFWKIPAALVLLLPRFSVRMKEWAYAGATFIYAGAIASHLTVGNGTGALIALSVFTILTAMSWALRPPSTSPNKP